MSESKTPSSQPNTSIVKQEYVVCNACGHIVQWAVLKLNWPYFCNACINSGEVAMWKLRGN